MKYVAIRLSAMHLPADLLLIERNRPAPSPRCCGINDGEISENAADHRRSSIMAAACARRMGAQAAIMWRKISAARAPSICKEIIFGERPLAASRLRVSRLMVEASAASASS